MGSLRVATFSFGPAGPKLLSAMAKWAAGCTVRPQGSRSGLDPRRWLYRLCPVRSTMAHAPGNPQQGSWEAPRQRWGTANNRAPDQAHQAFLEQPVQEGHEGEPAQKVQPQAVSSRAVCSISEQNQRKLAGWRGAHRACGGHLPDLWSWAGVSCASSCREVRATRGTADHIWAWRAPSSMGELPVNC